MIFITEEAINNKMTVLTKNEIFSQLNKLGIQSDFELNFYYEGYREYSEEPSQPHSGHVPKWKDLHHARAQERIPVNIKIRYLHQHPGHRFRNLLSGTIKNLSEKGMFIRTDCDIPENSLIEMCIPYKKEVLYIPANAIKIAWRRNISDTSCGGIGIVLPHPPREYAAFIESQKVSCNSQKNRAMPESPRPALKKFIYRLRRALISG
jgi:hypothetical protein